MNLNVKSAGLATVFVGVVGVALPYLASRWFTVWPLPLAVRAIGVAVATAGLALALWCVVLFDIVGGGTPAPLDPPRRLVTTGPYALVRNPMLSGMALLLAGEALAFASPGIAACAAAFFVLVNVILLTVEEPSLVRRFGADYEAYRRRVPRWIPRPPRARADRP
jgi:protein-S-isoprenylcysteine O-methyltransferase Ste14